MTRQQFKTKVLIIGSGPAGYSAAIYTARSSLQPILISGYNPGGQLTITTDVENYPGFADTIQGPWLMDQMKKQSDKVNVKIINDHIQDVNLDVYPFTVYGDSGNSYLTNSIIIATGASAKWLGLQSEKQFIGFGISSCATCDGFFYKGKNVLVVGGGNTAVEEALYLTHHAATVTIVHRRNKLRADKILQSRLFNNQKIKFLWNSVIEEVIGSKDPLSVKGAVIKNVNTRSLSTVTTDGIFIAIGHKPNTNLFTKKIDIDTDGYIITTPGSTSTSKQGVFAAGDVQDKTYRQAVTAAGTGCMAALEAVRFLELNL